MSPEYKEKQQRNEMWYWVTLHYVWLMERNNHGVWVWELKEEDNGSVGVLIRRASGKAISYW